MRLSVTAVEAFRLWRDTGDWMALEDLEATIKRETVPNEAMLRGRAFHDVIEFPDDRFVSTMGDDHYRSGEFQFNADGIRRVLTLLPPDRVSEVKTTTEIDGITLVGVADALRGLDAYEAKCTARVDVEKFFDSFQWRAYICLFRCARVCYLLAQGKDVGRYIQIGDVLPMWLYRYPKLDTDVRRLTNECAEFIAQRNLESYVKAA